MISDLSGKLIYGELAKAEVPNNLHEFTASLVQEQHTYKNKVTYKMYIDFKHRKNSQQNFTVNISNFKQPPCLIHLFKMEGQKSDKVTLMQKINRKCNMEVRKDPSKLRKIEEKIDLDDSDQDPADLILQESYDRESYSQAPSGDYNFSQLKNLVIQLVKNTPEGVTSIKEMRSKLERENRKKFSQRAIKNILEQVCDNNPQRRTRSYVLRPEYQSYEYGYSSNLGGKGQKKVKRDNSSE